MTVLCFRCRATAEACLSHPWIQAVTVAEPAEEEQQRVEREALEKSFAARLAGEKERQSKELEVAVMEAKNEANRTISELNRVVVTERAKLLAEQQENSRQLEEEWKMKEERLQHSLVEVEERENRWQVNTLMLMTNWLWKADKTKEVLYIEIGI